MTAIAAILAHNPGGSSPLLLPVLGSIPLLLVVAVILIVKRRNLPALFAIVAAMVAVGVALYLIVG